ncbi:MAG: hypothetical protein FK730_06785 [Asgard group archaeon]|nr:hypothetical protein [Asgard group archaeon]
MKQKVRILLIVIINLIICSTFSELRFSQSASVNFLKEESAITENIPNKFITSNSDELFNSEMVWSEPLQITTPILKRGDYKIKQALDGSIHCVFIKQLSLYGSGFFHIKSNNISSNEWSSPHQILQFDAKILEFDFIIENNNKTIHIGFIAKRETIFQVNYISKNESESELIDNLIIDKSFQNEFSSLNLYFDNNLLHMLWITKEVGTIIENQNCSIVTVTKNLLNSIWTQKRTLFDIENPILISITKLKNNNLAMTLVKWNALFDGNDIYVTTSSDNGSTWVNFTLIYEYNLEIEKMFIFSNNLTSGLHFFWESNELYKKVNHLEIYSNKTIKSDLFVLNNYGNSVSYFCGFYENVTSGDLHVFIEESNSGLFSLYYRKRLNVGLAWQVSIVLTTKSKSLIPNFISNKESNNPLIGKLVYKNYDIIIGSYFFNNDTLLNEHTILQMTYVNEKGSICVDSNKTIHYIWKYNNYFDNKIFYMSKTNNGSFEIHGCITGPTITDASDPKIVIDSKDNIHCFFVADDILTGFNGLFYTYKLAAQINWSQTELVKEPQNHAQSDNMEIKIDEMDTIHLIWGERNGLYQNRLYYSHKMESDEIFTNSVLLDNNEYIASIYPDFVIDSIGTIHFVYVEIDMENSINFIHYQFKLDGQSWSSPNTLTASTQYQLLQLELIIDSSDKLWMVYLRRYLSGPYVVSDSILMEKEFNDSWFVSDTLYTNEIINFHDFFITENDTLVYLQHNDNIPTDTIPDGPSDLVMVSNKIANQNWNEREQLALNTNYEYKPIGYFDNYSKNVFCIIYDKDNSYVNMQIITRLNDLDGDLLGDEDEIIFNTNPTVTDSDSDKLFDGEEVKLHHTNPALNDTDWDNLSDGREVINFNSNPLSIDTDNDNLLDGEEVYTWFTSPILSDTDSDNINDYDEIFVYGTDPTNEDTESDGMPDFWEIQNDLDPNSDDSFFDFDSDNLYNIEEFLYHTNPNFNDTDLDGLLDGDEVKIYFTNPLNVDTDEDTISDFDEILIFGTNPLLEDSDRDGFTDREEINAGTDPNDPRDNILRNRNQRIILGVVLPIVFISSLSAIFEIRYRSRIKKLYESELEEQQLENEKLENIAAD